MTGLESSLLLQELCFLYGVWFDTFAGKAVRYFARLS